MGPHQMDNISGEKFYASDKDSDTNTKKKRPKFKEQDKHGKKCHNKHSSLYFSLHGENNSHTTRECKVLKAKTKEKPKYSTNEYRRKYREVNLLEKEASHQRAKYLKYKKLNKAFAKKKTRVVLDDPSDSDSYSSSESQNFQNEDEKTSIAYDSESGNNNEINNSSTNTDK